MELVSLGLGIILGMIIADLYNNSRKVDGILKVKFDEDEPYLFLELTKEDMDNIYKKDNVVLKVDITRE